VNHSPPGTNTPVLETRPQATADEMITAGGLACAARVGSIIAEYFSAEYFS
jgi:hypothetical protein